MAFLQISNRWYHADLKNNSRKVLTYRHFSESISQAALFRTKKCRIRGGFNGDNPYGQAGREYSYMNLTDSVSVMSKTNKPIKKNDYRTEIISIQDVQE